MVIYSLLLSNVASCIYALLLLNQEFSIWWRFLWHPVHGNTAPIHTSELCHWATSQREVCHISLFQRAPLIIMTQVISWSFPLPCSVVFYRPQMLANEKGIHGCSRCSSQFRVPWIPQNPQSLCQVVSKEWSFLDMLRHSWVVWAALHCFRNIILVVWYVLMIQWHLVEWKKEKPLGIQYHLENTTQLEQIESFDLIIWSLPFIFWTTPKTRTFALYAC